MLQDVGAQLILQGVQSFVSGAQQATTAINNFSNRIDAVGSHTKNFGTSITATGNLMQRTGFILSFQLTAPLIALSKAVFNASTDFETAFTEVRKNVEATEPQFLKIEQSLRDVSKQTGVTAIDLATIAGEAGQVGIKSKDITAFTETIGKLRIATNLGAEATQELARIATLTGTTDFPALGSAITFVGANTNATEKEIVKMAEGLAGTARVIGLAAPDVIGLAAGFSSLGIKAEAGRGSFQKLGFAITDAVGDPKSKELKIFAEVAGQTAEEFATSFKTKPVDAILTFIDGLGQLRESGVTVKEKVFDAIGLSASEFTELLKTDSVGAVALYEKGLRSVGGEGTQLSKVLGALGFDEIRIRDLLLRSAAAHGDIAQAVSDSNNSYVRSLALEEEFIKKKNSTQGQLDILKARIVDAAIEIGKLITPDVLAAAKVFTQAIIDIAKAFAALDPQTRKNILLAGAFLAALAPIVVVLGALISLVGLVAQGLGLFILAIARLNLVLPKLLGQTTTIAKGFLTFGTAALGAAKAAGIGTTALFILQTGVTRLGLALRTLLTGFGPVGIALTGLAIIMDATGTDFNGLVNILIKAGALLLAGFVQLGSRIAATFLDMNAEIGNALGAIGRAIRDFLITIPLIGGGLSELVGKMAEQAQSDANNYRVAAGNMRMEGDKLTESIINAANAALIKDKANVKENESLDKLPKGYTNLKDKVDEFGESAVKASDRTRKFGDLLDEDGKKVKKTKEEVLSAAEAFERFINSLSAPELAAYAIQTDINRIAQDAMFKSLEDELRAGNIAGVSQVLFDIGKTGMEAFEFISAALKKIQEEGPRTSAEIVAAAKAARLLDDQFKFFETDAKRMVSEGLIDQVAEQLINMGKTGVEAIAFINAALAKLQEEEQASIEKTKLLREEFIKQGMATEELAAKQRAASAEFLHDQKLEIDAIEEKIRKEKEAAVSIVNLAAQRRAALKGIDSGLTGPVEIGGQTFIPGQGSRDQSSRIINDAMLRIESAIRTGTFGAQELVAARRIQESIGDLSPISIDRISAELLLAQLKASDLSFQGLSFQHGGITPGNPSQKMMAQVHGGETILPASLRNMEFSLIDKLVHAISGLGNKYEINANYTNTQSPASISLDMAALMAMSRN